MPRVRRDDADFRLFCQAVFLTFAQVNDATAALTAEDFAVKLRYKHGERLAWMVVAKERHADGGIHFHALLHFGTRKFSTRNVAEWDEVCGTHPNIGSARSLQAALRYISPPKDSLIDRFEDGPVPPLKTEKTNKMTEFARDVDAGQTTQELYASYVGLFAQNLTKCLAFIEWRRAVLTNNALEPRGTFEFQLTPDPAFNHACSTLLQHLTFVMKDWNYKAHRPIQLYVNGPPACGKSSLGKWLERFMRVYWCPMDEDYYNLYADERYDLIILEEFWGQKKASFMNALLDGSTFSMRTKGGQVMKRKTQPVVIFSNVKLNTIYSSMESRPEIREAFQSRLLEVTWQSHFPNLMEVMNNSYVTAEGPPCPRET